MLVSIIIINYNTFTLTCDCIRSITQYVRTPYEIVLVDNCSPDDDPDEFLKLFPQITLVKNPENNGFAKGNNLGILHSKGDVVLLLNSDTYLTEDCISAPASFVREHKNIGAAGVKLVYTDGRYQNSGRKFRNITRELLDLARPLLYLLPYKKRAQLMLNQYFKGDFNTECDWVIGAYMIFRKEILEQLPEKKLDERFFMYGEDELWCYQIQQTGYQNYFLADYTLVHIANASTEPSKQLRLLKLFVKHQMIIMEYMKGKGLYYYVFKIIYAAKDYTRYYIKLLVQKIFGYKIR